MTSQRAIVGLAGFRRSGKSEIAKHLIENHGFRSVHPFGIWKRAIVTFYTEIGISREDAEAMVDGHLKDTGCENLPDGVSSRFLMEELGNFTGTKLGPKWTIGLAIKKILDEEPDARLVVESIVYEADVVRELGGHIIMVDRPGQDGMGHKTDEVTRNLKSDSHFLNDGNDLELMKLEFDAHLAREGIIKARDEELQPG
jgi:hypothetical protein